MLQESKSAVSLVSDYVYSLFKNKLPAYYVYHNLKHTEEVAANALKISEKLNLNDDDKEIVVLAAWLHDTGFIERVDNHEDISIDIARKFLKELNYSDEKIELIAGCINATKYPQNPKNLLEEITADADLFHLGTKDFEDKTELLRLEWEKTRGRNYSEAEWLKINSDFLTSHKYFTRYAKKALDENKTATLLKIQKKLRKANKDLSKAGRQKSKLDFQKKMLEAVKRSNSGNDPDSISRAIDTAGILTEFINAADRKANLMTGLNGLFTAGIFSIVLTTLYINVLFIIPAAFLLTVNVTCMIISIIAAKHNAASNKYNDAVNIKQNSVLFNYSGSSKSETDLNPKLKDNPESDNFTSDRLNNDLFLLGSILKRKNGLLKICYIVFITGMIISVLAFAAAYIITSYPRINLFI
ncbi:MAG: HD domain-containing protein [Ignavibacteria bacterium]|nr:HD domain-containing protein [Ignavibacteria bacterium]